VKDAWDFTQNRLNFFTNARHDIPHRRAVEEMILQERTKTVVSNATLSLRVVEALTGNGRAILFAQVGQVHVLPKKFASLVVPSEAFRVVVSERVDTPVGDVDPAPIPYL